MTKIILSTIIFFAPQILASTTIIDGDFIKCERGNSRFRQFCYVNEDKIQVTSKLAPFVELGGLRLEYFDIIKNRSVVLENTNDQNQTIELKGLSPYLKGSYEWSTFSQCMRSSLWQEDIQIEILTVGSPTPNPIFSFSPGFGYFDENLSDHEHIGKRLIEYTMDDESINLNVGMIVNGRGLNNFTFSDERMPRSCKMDLKNTYLGFSSTEISKDLTKIKSFVNTRKLIMNKSLLLHGFYLEQANGLRCIINTLSQAIRSLELNEMESWEMLSFAAKQTIIEAMEQAYELGAINLNEIPRSSNDYWEHFVSEDFQEILSNSCVDSQQDLFVSVGPFLNDDGEIINAAGYKNAEDYLRERRNIHSLISAAWAFVEMGRLEVDTSTELDWILDTSIYANLNQ